jgi:TP901 family phage tail tape measure protein
MRTIALRLVGTSEGKEQLEELGEDTEGYIESVSKLRDTIKDATKAAAGGEGFDILDANGNYKSTYEIMEGLSDLYDDIVEKDKELGTNNLNLLLETIAGKNRSNIAASILQNHDMLVSAYNSSAYESDNSAQNELNAYLESLDAKIAQFQNKLQELESSLISSEFLKNVVDAGTTILSILNQAVDKFGVLATLAPVVAGALTFENIGNVHKCVRLNCFEYAYHA